ncbi:MAG: Maf family protein [Ilumatobacteraceae bacterium]
MSIGSTAPVVLASQSPRRRELLGHLCPEFEVVPADIDETPFAAEDALTYVERLARTKAETVVRLRPAHAVIAADTTVDLDGEILGKPETAEEACEMLRRLSDRTHRVHTGVAIGHDGQLAHGVSTALVRFLPVTEREIAWYVGTGEPMDKAGAYGLQGAGGAFVEQVTGSVSAIVGLPLTLLLQLAGRVGVDLLRRQA